ncbi:MAG: dihydroorotase [Bacteroidales bacterium]|nr:dihydroorotase [Bacteroidales bacterium]
MAAFILENATIINEGLSFKGGIFVKDGIICDVFDYEKMDDRLRESNLLMQGCAAIDLKWHFVAPGVIDTHVHFREPGATHKGCIATESAAAVVGGVTSYLDMPNNDPPVTTAEGLKAKMDIAARDSLANYGFYLGASDYNGDQVTLADATGACAVKVFLGASTGNLMVHGTVALGRIFARSPLLIAAHCEDSAIIDANVARFIKLYGDDIPVSAHPAIRTAAACMSSTRQAVDLALETGARLHIMHVSTAQELDLIAEAMAVSDRITAETCVQYLWFDDSDYEQYGAQIKCNPAIKTAADRRALCDAVRDGVIKTISTDHAPHLLSEKQGGCLQAASGIPLVQYSLLMMLEKVKEGLFSLPMVVEKMCHAPARLFFIDKRGFIRKGYYADLVVFDMDRPSDVAPVSRCGWSPLTRFSSTIEYTYVNGCLAARDGAPCAGEARGMQLNYTR